MTTRFGHGCWAMRSMRLALAASIQWRSSTTSSGAAVLDGVARRPRRRHVAGSSPSTGRSPTSAGDGVERPAHRARLGASRRASTTDAGSDVDAARARDGSCRCRPHRRRGRRRAGRPSSPRRRRRCRPGGRTRAARPTITGLIPTRPLSTASTLGPDERDPACRRDAAGRQATRGRRAVTPGEVVGRRAGDGGAATRRHRARRRRQRQPAAAPTARRRAAGPCSSPRRSVGELEGQVGVHGRAPVGGWCGPWWTTKAAAAHRTNYLFPRREQAAMRCDAGHLASATSVGSRRHVHAPSPHLAARAGCPAPTGPAVVAAARHRPATASRGSPGGPPAPTRCGCAASSGRCRVTAGRRPVVVDDAHLLGPDDVDRLVEHIEDAPASTAADHRRAHPRRRASTRPPSSSTGRSSTPTPWRSSADEVARRARRRLGDAGPAARRGCRRQRPRRSPPRSTRASATRRPTRRPRLAHGPGRQRRGAAAARRRREQRRRRPARPGARHRPPPARPPRRRRVRRSGRRRRRAAAPPGHRRARPGGGGVVPRARRSTPSAAGRSPTSCSSAGGRIEAVGLAPRRRRRTSGRPDW